MFTPHSFFHTGIMILLSRINLARASLYSDREYHEWVRSVESSLNAANINHRHARDRPLISLVIPFLNTPDRYLDQLMNSLMSQKYRNWELIMVDASDKVDRMRAVKAWSERDERFRYVKIDKNYHISTNTNKGIKQARGKYVAFADHDDVLSINAMNEVAVVIANEDPDIIYSDEDKLTDDGKIRHTPYFKPDWSPHLFWFTNYTNHLSVIRKNLVDRVGGLDPDFNGSQDYELLLRIHAKSPTPLKVSHIPKILYHWREAPQSTASNHTKKSYAFVAGKKALEAYFKRKKIIAKTHYIENSPGFYKQVVAPSPNTKVVITIANGIGDEYIRKLKSLTKTNLEVSYILSSKKIPKSDVLVEITKECYPLKTTWLDELVGVSQIADVTCVSPRILDVSGKRVSDAGAVTHPYFSEFSSYKNLQHDEHTPTGGVWWVRDVEVLPAAVRVYQSKHSKHSNKDNKSYNVVWSHVDFRLTENR